jgi:hypothetical protein
MYAAHAVRRRMTAKARRGRANSEDRSAGAWARSALVIAALVYVALSNLTPISESDFWIQLKVGDEIRRTGSIPPTIEYTFTEARDLPFIAHEWLPSALTSALFTVVGYPGMIVFKCLLAIAVTALAAALSFRINRNLVASVLIASAAATAMNFRFQMRPEIFAFLLALTSLYLLTAFVASGRRVYLVGLVPIAAVWANSHGSALLNLALPWIFLGGELLDDLRSRRLADPRVRGERIAKVYGPLAAAGIAMALVSLANPYGLHLFTHAFATGQADWLRDNIVEFGATFDERSRAAPYFWVYLAYLGALLASLVPGRRRINGTSLLLLAVFGALSLASIRYTAWFALVGTYVLAHTLSELGRSPTRRTTIALAGIAALGAGLVVSAVHGDVRGHRIGFRNEAPMSPEALQFVRSAGISGNVFNTFSHGDQLIHDFYPGIRVAIDSRTDAYGEEYYLRYRSLSGRSFKALGPPGDLVAYLDRYAVDTIVTRPLEFKNWNDKGHVQALERTGWAVVYADPTTVVLRRGATIRPV